MLGWERASTCSPKPSNPLNNYSSPPIRAMFLRLDLSELQNWVFGAGYLALEIATRGVIPLVKIGGP